MFKNKWKQDFERKWRPNRSFSKFFYEFCFYTWHKDKVYSKKANNCEGRVGDETVIISQEVYGQVKQEKFIPVIFEVDENNKAYCPHYIKSRIYIDLSTEDDRYETEYEKITP